MSPRVCAWLILALLTMLAGCAGHEPYPPELPDDPASGSATAAVVSLVDEARLAHDQGDYEAAIAVAERGLRIDRREPELYLIMAQSYLALDRSGKSAQFARQGMRHCPPDSHLYQALETTLSRAEDSSSNISTEGSFSF